MLEIGDAKEEEDAEDVEVVVVGGDKVVLAHHLQTTCETHKWQEDKEKWHLQG